MEILISLGDDEDAQYYFQIHVSHVSRILKYARELEHMFEKDIKNGTSIEEDSDS